jgi:hypothetical protein
MMLDACNDATGMPVESVDMHLAEIKPPERQIVKYERRLVADGDGTRSQRVHHCVDPLAMLPPGPLPGLQPR